MKRWTFKVALILCIIYLCACSNNPEEEIIGYWMRGDGYTISFTDSSTCSLGEGAPQTYKIYDKNHLQIVDSTGNGVSEFVFEVDGDLLKIRLVAEEGYTEFTKDEETQKQILEEMRELEKEQQEFEEELRIKELIQSEITNKEKEIIEFQDLIRKNLGVIEIRESEILIWKNNIQSAHDLYDVTIKQGNDEIEARQFRDEQIADYNVYITECEQCIENVEAENIKYQENIDLILLEIEELEKEIETLKKLQ